ncbi:MAG TPA: ATP-binding protein [Allosphingosinicella sp.]|jgi:PAS domain S-box-containing protein|nr:ATP-binding protein [Allosphingosinicella sp.]
MPDPKRAARREPISVLALAAIPLILILLGFVLWEQFEQSRRLQSEVDASYAARLEVQQLLSLHQDIETGYRGYLVTGNPLFLEPYSRARPAVEPAMKAVRTSLVPAPRTAPLYAHLDELSRAKLRLADRIVALRRSGRLPEADAMIGSGKALMDAIRRHIAGMETAEQAWLRDRVDKADSARRRAELTTFALLALLGALLFGAAYATQQRLRSEREALRRASRLSTRQSAIFDSTRDGLVMLNLSGSVESLNPAAAAMFGYDLDDLVRRDVGHLFELAPDEGRVETFLRRLAGRHGARLGTAQEFWGRRKSGETFPTEVSVSPVPLDDGTRYVVVVRDVTERKQVETMKTEFVSTVSHELRTPLTSIAGSLGLLLGGAAGEIPDKAARLIKIAHSNCDRLVRLINDILDIEKIETGKLAFAIRPLALAPMIETVMQANQAFADAHDVRLETGPLPADAVVMADEDRLMQVFTNLLSNAVKFSPPSGAVTLSVERLDRRYRVSVADRGSGIPDEFRTRIFQKFAQADSSDTRQKGGTGLGLSIVREIVSRLGGAVAFEDRPGGGTVFHVDLPAAPGEPSSEPRPAAGAGSARILHVDDDPDVARIVSGAFEGRAEVVEAYSLAQARALLGRDRFDLLILDIALPDGSGLELLPEIRAREGAPLPVIVFTAQDAAADLPEGLTAVLTKSRASIDRLVEVAGEALARGGTA